MMRGIFACARDAFSLFQLHMKHDERTLRGYFGDNGSFSTILAAGDVAIVAIDLRSERTLNQVASAATYNELKHRMLQMNCKHALCVVGIPILYPPHTSIHHVIDKMNPDDKNEFFATLLKKFNKNLRLCVLLRFFCCRVCNFRATYVCIHRNGPFGEPENLDDLNDHWTSQGHAQEQLSFMKLLHHVATQLPCRITILSGDVHTCCVQELQPALHGPSLMVNIVTSGMRHSPMPSVVAAFIKELPCQRDIPLGDALWDVVPRQWQKVRVYGC